MSKMACEVEPVVRVDRWTGRRALTEDCPWGFSSIRGAAGCRDPKRKGIL